MQHNTVTIASVYFTFGWARFMGTGFFGVDKTMNG